MKNYSSNWIFKLEDQRHWIYYWNQVRILRNYIHPDSKILEIGVGTSFTSNYLKSKGYNVTTIDIDENKKPDIVADITDYNFETTFDYVIAFEVFEHIPYDKFEQILEKLHSVADEKIIFSIPRNEKVWFRINIELPGSKQFHFSIQTLRNKILSKHHYWELDYKKYTKKYLEQVFKKKGYSVESKEKVFSLMFYTLKK